MRPYLTDHERLWKLKGKAAQQVCVDCPAQACDWSHIHDTDPKLPDNYEPRCRSCHVKYDGNCMQPGSKHPHAKLTEEDVIAIREMRASGVWKQRDLCAIFKIGEPQMSAIVHRKAWTHI